MKTKFKKHLLIIAGILSLCLGTIGILLPLLPTTPFLLLSAYCFTKSSVRLHNWLINHKVFGRYISNYINYHAIPKKTKFLSILLLWLTLMVSILLLQKILVTFILVIVGISVSIHLLTLNSLESNEAYLRSKDLYSENRNCE